MEAVFNYQKKEGSYMYGLDLEGDFSYLSGFTLQYRVKKPKNITLVLIKRQLILESFSCSCHEVVIHY